MTSYLADSCPQPDDVAAKVRQFFQPFNNRRAFGVENIAESYCRGDIEVNTLICIEPDYCLIRAQAVAHWQEHEAAHVTVPRKSKIFYPGSDGYQFAVFTLVAEPVQGSQHFVASLIRLKRLDFGAVSFRNMAESPGIFPKEFLAFGDNKCCGRIVNGPITLGNRPGELVKAIPLGLDNHSGCRRDLRRDAIRHDDLMEPPFSEDICLSCIGLPGHLRLRFFSDHIGLSAHELGKIVLEDCDLGICPINFSETAFKHGGGHG